jgi:hypothetical protein
MIDVEGKFTPAALCEFLIDELEPTIAFVLSFTTQSYAEEFIRFYEMQPVGRFNRKKGNVEEIRSCLMEGETLVPGSLRFKVYQIVEEYLNERNPTVGRKAFKF